MKKNIKISITNPGVHLDPDITFAQVPGWCSQSTRDLKISMLRPFGITREPLPLIIWLCGGSWVEMDRNVHLPNFIEFAEKGYVVASLDYRTSMFGSFPDSLIDIKAAIRYLRANANQFQINPEKIGIMGESAGGHLAALVGTTGQEKEYDQGCFLHFSSVVQAVCTWYPPIDLMHIEEETDLRQAYEHKVSPITCYLGTESSAAPDLARKASPIAYVCPTTPPFLMFHGAADYFVPSRESDKLFDVLQAAGVPAEYYLVEEAGHADIRFFQPEIKNIILNFFNTVFNYTGVSLFE